MTPTTEAFAALMPQPFEYLYEFASPFGGTTLRESASEYNGNRPKRSVAIYTDDQLRAAMQAVWDAATERAAKQEREAKVCPNCKGTRSPSLLDPEWKGRCECVDPSTNGAVIAAYALPTVAGAYTHVRIERAQQVTGVDLWAVRCGGDVLNKDGEWEWEPMPSSRDDDFLARARFNTAEEGIAAAIRASGGKGA